jgi:periplasmic copper chaperone A
VKSVPFACLFARLSAALFAAALAGAAFAQVDVKDPWVRATVPEQKSTGAFMQLSAPSGARLVEVQSNAASVVELHEMSMEGSTMKMRAVPGIDLPPGKTVDLKPGGYHLMLMGLKQQLKDGETIPLTLVVEGADKKLQRIELKVPVRPLGAPPPTGGAKH